MFLVPFFVKTLILEFHLKERTLIFELIASLGSGLVRCIDCSIASEFCKMQEQVFVSKSMV